MAIKNAVTMKKTPSFWSTWAVTKNLDFMNSLTKKQAKANKIARESKWKVAESCAWAWTEATAMSMAEAKQKPIIISVQSMWIWWRCTTTKPAASAGAATSGSTASSLAAAWSGTSELAPSPEDEGCIAVSETLRWVWAIVWWLEQTTPWEYFSYSYSWQLKVLVWRLLLFYVANCFLDLKFVLNVSIVY